MAQAAPLFIPGRVVITLDALKAIEAEGVDPKELASRHLSGDWGNLDPEGCTANEAALAFGSRLIGSYSLPSGRRVWIITDADRSSTCLLLPEEY